MKKKCFFKVITITKRPVNKISTCRRNHTESIQQTSFSVMWTQEWITATHWENLQCCQNHPMPVYSPVGGKSLRKEESLERNRGKGDNTTCKSLFNIISTDLLHLSQYGRHRVLKSTHRHNGPCPPKARTCKTLLRSRILPMLISCNYK